MKNALLLFAALLILCPAAGAQAPVGDCLGAIPVCQQIYQENQSPSGGGNVLEINNEFNCMLVELNSIWYSFTVNQSGDFGFLLTPNNPDDDYDWALFNITNANCEDLFNNSSLIVSCNAAGGTGCHGPTGATGTTSFDDQGFGCGSVTPNTFSGFSPFNDLVPVQAGNTYVLCVSNWTGSPNGYVIDFGLSSDIGIFDEDPPFVESADIPAECVGEVSIVFSEFIQCATIDALNFQITGPGGPYSISLSSVNCDAGGNFSKEFTLNINPPVDFTGDFELQLVVDGSSEALDLCGNPAAPEVFSFSVVNPLPPIDIGPDTTLCPGAVLFLDATTPGAAYQWQDASTAAILEVSQPGTYSVTVSQGCHRQEDEITVGYYPAIEAGLDDGSLCEGETVTLDVTTPSATYQWQDGASGPVYTVVAPGDYSVTITTVCEEKVLEASFDLIVEAPEIDLGPDTTICPGAQLILEVNAQEAVYQWQDGSSESSFVIDRAGLYAVTVTNACGQEMDAVEVSLYGAIDLNIVSDTFLCPGETILLDATAANATFYQWEDGTTQPRRSIVQPGHYRISAGNNCETVTASVQVKECEICDVFIPNGFSPNDDGVNDLFLPYSDCPLSDFSMRIFDRWGAVLFESTDSNQGWNGKRNGKAMNPGAYVWTIEFTVVENNRPRTARLSGEVHLLR
jgi:gliding motility-associated-like protein